MSETIEQKKIELAKALETEIKGQVNQLMETNFRMFCGSVLSNTRDDQLEKILGKELLGLIKEFVKLGK